MKRCKSVEQYCGMVDWFKRNNDGCLRNNVYLLTDVEKWIKDSRLYYIDSEAALLLFIDQVDYWELVYYVASGSTANVQFALDKPVCVRNYYVESSDKSGLASAEAWLRGNGFTHRTTMRSVYGDAESVLGKIEGMAMISLEIMRESELKIVTEPSPMLFQKCREFRDSIHEIPIWQTSFTFDEEYKNALLEGRLIPIENDKDEIVALRYTFVNKRAVYGWLGVRDDYKNGYGISVYFSYLVAKYALEHQYALQGWIDVININSIKYHQKIGYCWGNRYVDEWVKESG